MKKLERINKLLTIKQDQEEKQVVNTIREVPPEMYNPAHLLIPPQDKLSLFRKHIPKQQEIDALLKNLHKRVLIILWLIWTQKISLKVTPSC